jgi:hypothetical protein
VTDDPLTAVHAAARKFHNARAERDAARDELLDAIRVAYEQHGERPETLIRAAGLARQTVYDALKRPAPDTDPTPKDTP